MQQPLTARQRSNPITRFAAGAVALGALALGACSTPTGAGAAPGSTPTAAAQTSTYPLDVTTGDAGSGRTITIAEQPAAIVSLSATATETLFAVGAGDQVVAVDKQSDFPTQAPLTELSGYTPNVEAILAYSPDLVVAADDDADLIASLDKAAVPALVLPSVRTLDGAYEQIERVGTVTGHEEAAAALVAEMRTDIAAAVARAPQASGLTYFHELDPTLHTVTGDTFIGDVYALFGMESIAAAGGGDAYPQLSAEFVVAANPDVIFLSDAQCCGVTPGQVAARPGWADVAAVRNGQVHVHDEDVASRWGPRVVEFVETVSDHVATLERVAG